VFGRLLEEVGRLLEHVGLGLGAGLRRGWGLGLRGEDVVVGLEVREARRGCRCVRGGALFDVLLIADRGVLGRLGVSVTRRIAGTTASRWVPFAGAAAVGAYAYWDTLQVAKTARRLLAESALVPSHRDAPGVH